jgi:hypothetical protein
LYQFIRYFWIFQENIRSIANIRSIRQFPVYGSNITAGMAASGEGSLAPGLWQAGKPEENGPADMEERFKHKLNTDQP